MGVHSTMLFTCLIVRRFTVSHALVPNVRRMDATALCSQRASVRMQFRFPWDQPKPAAPKPKAGPSFEEALAFKDKNDLTEEEERKLKLEIGTNWRPRTSTVKGEGYQFFQGPTPKTGVQEDMPDFFSKDNLDAVDVQELGLAPKVVGGVAVVLLLWLTVTLILA